MRAETAVTLAALVSFAAAIACSPAPGKVESAGARGAATNSNGVIPQKTGDLGAKNAIGAAPAGSGEPAPEGPRPGRAPLGEPIPTPLEASIEPISGGRSVLFVAQAAGERVAWARRFGGAAKAMGPLLRFQDEHVLSAFEGDSGAPLTIVTSDGERLCLSTFQDGSDKPIERGCVAAAPFAVVAVGERFALIEAEVERKPEPPGASKPAAKKAASEPKKSTKPAPKPKKDRKARPVKRLTKTSKATTAKGGASSKNAPKDAKATAKAGSQPTGKKGSATAQKQQPKRAETTARKPPRTDKVNVKLRFLSRAGVFEGEAVGTGLSFERPLEGLSLIDARGRPGGVDLAWFEASPKRLTPAPMGSARIAGGTIRVEPAVAFDPASRVPVLEGDLDYSGIAGHHAGRLIGSSAVTLFVGLTGKPGGCEAVRIAPSLSLITPAPNVCSIAPHKLAEPGGGASRDDLTVMEKIAAVSPQRTFGQPRHDPGLAAWAGDRAFFLREGKVAWVSAKDGEPQESEPPFPARRSRIAWGGLHSDGEGIALVEGVLYRLDAQGIAAKVDGAPPASGNSGANGAAPAPPLATPERSAIDRRRVARSALRGGSRAAMWSASPLPPPKRRRSAGAPTRTRRRSRADLFEGLLWRSRATGSIGSRSTRAVRSRSSDRARSRRRCARGSMSASEPAGARSWPA